MCGGPCLHYDCSNRNSFGYCKTTVCINEHYQREQWGFPSSTNKSESAVIKPQTNADWIRAMTDEELADWLAKITDRTKLVRYHGQIVNGNYSFWLTWLAAEEDPKWTKHYLL